MQVSIKQPGCLTRFNLNFVDCPPQQNVMTCHASAKVFHPILSHSVWIQVVTKVMGPHLCQTNAVAVLDFSFPTSMKTKTPNRNSKMKIQFLTLVSSD